MELEDYLEPEIAVTAAVTAALFSRRGRQIIRRGAVYGLAGALIAGDAITSFARSIGQSFKQVVPETPSTPEGAPQEQGGQAG